MGKRKKRDRDRKRAYKTLKLEAERNAGKIRNRGSDKDMPVWLTETWGSETSRSEDRVRVRQRTDTFEVAREQK